MVFFKIILFDHLDNKVMYDQSSIFLSVLAMNYNENCSCVSNSSNHFPLVKADLS